MSGGWDKCQRGAAVQPPFFGPGMAAVCGRLANNPCCLDSDWWAIGGIGGSVVFSGGSSFCVLQLTVCPFVVGRQATSFSVGEERDRTHWEVPAVFLLLPAFVPVHPWMNEYFCICSQQELEEYYSVIIHLITRNVRYVHDVLSFGKKNKGRKSAWDWLWLYLKANTIMEQCTS